MGRGLWALVSIGRIRTQQMMGKQTGSLSLSRKAFERPSSWTPLPNSLFTFDFINGESEMK